MLFASISLACGPSAPARSAARPPRPREAPRPPSPSYQTLDGRLHYYAVVRVEDFEDHFTATFHDVEGAYCHVSVSTARGVQLRGCGYPATIMQRDEVPRDRERLLPALREAVLAEETRARSLRFRYEGSYRVVVLEEEVPCEGKHGNGYYQVELRYDADLKVIQERRFLIGSTCGAAPFYWASPEPRWLPFTSTRTQLAPGSSAIMGPLPADLTTALQAVLATPNEDHGTPPEPARGDSIAPPP
jgi:hypothetical protein